MLMWTSLTLDGTSSYDPDGTTSSFNYDWSCKDATTLAQCNLPGVNLAQNNLTIDAYSLPIGSYQFTLLVSETAGIRNDTSSVYIDIVSGSTPVVSVQPLLSAKYNVDDEYLSLVTF
jgi:hypothetical protein